MDINNELGGEIQELQILERNLQSLSMEKQTLQVELNEINNASEEIKKSGDEVYKIISGIMVKSDSASLTKSLSERKKILEMRINAIEKNESEFESKTETLRSEINSKIIAKKG